MVGHDEYIELLGAYALDAVDQDERRTVEAHLAVCPACQAEVLQHLAVAAALSTQYPATMPTELWDRIVTQIDATPTDDAGEPMRLPRLAMLEPRDEPATAPPQDAGAAVVSLDHARRSRRPGSIAAGLLAAAAAIVMVVLGTGMLRANQRASDADQVAASLTLQLARPAVDLAAERALADPTSKKFVLTSAGAAKATAVVTGSGEGYLVPEGMATLPPDRAYQLWEIGGAGPVSLGVIGNEPRATAFHVHGPVGMLAVTNEVAGGVPSPQTTPLLTATA